MNPRVWESPWRLMLAVNVAVFFGIFLHKIALPPYVPYIHLLVDYHFGFTKRALIGAIVSLFDAKVPVQLYLVPAALEGSFGYLAAPAAQPPRRAGIRAFDLAARAALAIFSL
jgi:hypothetical protein